MEATMILKLFVCPTCGHAELQNANYGWPHCEGGPTDIKHMQRMSYVHNVDLAKATDPDSGEQK